MDARITKSRLSNLLSYDWLKIIAAVAVAIVALCVFFTTVKTRPRAGQHYEILAYSDLQAGTDSSTFASSLGDVFSYDILKVTAETLSGNPYSGAVFSSLRATGSGNAMFIGNWAQDDGKEETEDKGTLQTFVEGFLVWRDDGTRGLEILLDTEEYLRQAEDYIASAFGENWRENGEIDEAVAREYFFARNGKDKRFRTQKAKEAGVLQEIGRLEGLREDLAFVDRAFEKGVLSHVVISTEAGDFTVGISLAKLSKLGNLYYYAEKREDETVHSIEKEALVLLNNGGREGDLVYESVSLIRYLVETYYVGELP